MQERGTSEEALGRQEEDARLGRRPLRRREKEKRARFIVPLRGGSWREHNAAGVGNGGGGNHEAEGNGGGGKPGRERGASEGAETGVLGGGAKFAGTCPLVQVILAGASERRGVHPIIREPRRGARMPIVRWGLRQLPLLLICALVLVSASPLNAQVFHKKKKVNKSTDATNTAEPDKQLYDKAVNDVKHGRHEVGRLGLQTLINTYPDSEYLAKAKLAIADSYYKEGGTANTTQAIAGYKDFIVFFPFLPEAPYAQIQVAMTHYKQMEKPDRDRTEAKAAEEEFQTFLAKYPKDPLVPKAEQHLRDVQEVLAEGDFRIGYYYYVKGDKRASAGRLLSITKRYPLYSRSDEALWMLGDIFEKSEKKEVASIYYSRIVKEYPLSPRVGDAKDKLVAFHVPVPQPD